MLGLSGSGLTGAENQTTVANFRDQTGVTFPLLLNDWSYDDYAFPNGWISPYPLDVIVDQQGIVRYIGRQYDGEVVKATIEQLLAEGG